MVNHNQPPITDCAPWEVDMSHVRQMDIGKALTRLAGTVHQLTAPLAAPAGVFRPSFSGDMTQCKKTEVSLTFDRFESGVDEITLHIPGVANGIGRPLFGYDGTGGRGFFGDADSVDSGFSSLMLTMLPSGMASLRAKKIAGGLKLLSGVTREEMAAFAIGCTTAVGIHELKQEREALRKKRARAT